LPAEFAKKLAAVMFELRELFGDVGEFAGGFAVQLCVDFFCGEPFFKFNQRQKSANLNFTYPTRENGLVEAQQP
jgi:hypothetical protein